MLVAWRASASGSSAAAMPRAVVAHAHQADAAALDVDLDALRAGVEAVFDQFLDDRGRPLDHLAGGDLVDELPESTRIGMQAGKFTGESAA